MSLPITPIVNVSVSNPSVGLSNYNVNNLALLTKEAPISDIPAAGYFIYADASSVASDWGSTSETYSQAVNIFSQSPNILSGDGRLIVYKMAADETLNAAILAVNALVFAGGFIYGGYSPTNEEITTAAATIESLRRLLHVVTNVATDYVAGGLGYLVMEAKQVRTRVLWYGGTALAGRAMLAAYAGRGMSTNFAGVNTAQNMHLKELVNVTPDTTVTQQVYNSLQLAGMDCYTNVAGLPKVMTSGANDYFDNVYNLNWFVGALEVAGFNALATTSTKIPQTEAGMSYLKDAYEYVCRVASQVGFIAPGQWNSPDTFGDVVTFRRNISAYGYYVYSIPIAIQSQADREGRKAPLCMVAIKYAGAINSTSIMVYLNK